MPSSLTPPIPPPPYLNQAERAALADALALSTAMHAQSEEDRAAAARAEAAASLPPEPAKGGGEVRKTHAYY